MENVVAPPDDLELHLLTEWGTVVDPQVRRKSAVVSIVAHIVLVVALLTIPSGPEPQQAAEVHHIVTPLIDPPTELTQKTPNKRPPTKEFNVAEEKPRPRIQIPGGAPSTNRPRAAIPAEVPQPPTPRPTPLPEPPKLEANATPPNLPPIAQTSPQIEPVEKPKLPFEDPPPAPTPLPPGQGRLPPVNPSVSEAIRQAVKGSPGAGLTIGDPDLSVGPGGIGEAITLPPAPGTQGSQLELLSDPMGVDFRSYLTQVLAAVRRNWVAVIPESAKLGRQGRVGIQFAIAKNGSVPKLVITTHSGTDALDRAAVAGVSASNPFPPLPSEFKGDVIRLQFNFAYNMPKR
jgi:TonB family protein